MSEYSVRRKKSRGNAFSKRVIYSTPKMVNPYTKYYKEYQKENIYIGNLQFPISSGKVTEQNYLREIERLRKIVSILFRRAYEQGLQNFPDYNIATEGIEIAYEKEVSIEEAKAQIHSYLRNYFQSNKEIYPSDVADALKIKYEIVREAFALLENEGKLIGNE